jgi:shikimate kinase/uncharacterized protein YjbI with pentapeptide repeats
VSARAEAVRIGLAAAGAVVALLVALRRQRSTEFGFDLQYDDISQKERAAEDVRLDGVERRITELFTKAVEQTGSDKAQVRLGGLYSLERIAQDYEQHRGTIVEVICAYLRAPYPGVVHVPAEAGLAALEHAGAAEPVFETTLEQQQERHVRLAALSILARHLRGGTEGWPGVELKLAGSVLFDADFRDCRIAVADFRAARFVGRTRFDRVTFDGSARFEGAWFGGEALFPNVTFGGTAGFSGVVFAADANFGAAKFGQGDQREASRFDRARFCGMAGFGESVFGGYTSFAAAKFLGTAWFSAAVFERPAEFGQTEFTGSARFDHADFREYARFDAVRFAAETLFTGARFSDDAWFNSTAFGGKAAFRGATFAQLGWFGGCDFRGDAEFDHVRYGRAVWFGRARFRGVARFDPATFPPDTGFDEVVLDEPAMFIGPRRPWPQSTDGMSALSSITPRRVFLVGLMGSGKSTIGTELAAILGCEYLDNDVELEKRTGFDAPALVRKFGAKALHAEESRYLHDVLTLRPPFIAGVAGSVGDRPHELALMAEAGQVVYLRTSPETLAKRVGSGEGRPLLQGKDPVAFFEKQTSERDPNFSTAAGVYITKTDGRDPRLIAQELADYLAFLEVDEGLVEGDHVVGEGVPGAGGGVGAG